MSGGVNWGLFSHAGAQGKGISVRVCPDFTGIHLSWTGLSGSGHSQKGTPKWQTWAQLMCWSLSHWDCQTRNRACVRRCTFGCTSLLGHNVQLDRKVCTSVSHLGCGAMCGQLAPYLGCLNRAIYRRRNISGPVAKGDWTRGEMR